MTVPIKKLMKAITAAVMSTPECGTSQKPRKITLPVMLATKTCPRTSTLIASTSPVANVSSSSATTVSRSETGDATAMGEVSPIPLSHLRCEVQRRHRRHLGHQPVTVLAFELQAVGEIFHRRNVLAQRAGGGRVGVHDRAGL